MISYEQILQLIDKLNESTLSEIKISEGDFNLTLKRKSFSSTEVLVNNPNYVGYVPGPSTVPEQKNVVEEQNLIEIISPMVGTFYAAPSPDSEPFVQIGKQIKPGDVLCIIEAMKMMNEFPAEVSGTVQEICVSNSETVEYGQVLFKIKA